MFGRPRLKPPVHEPLVTDRHGRVVGVRTPPPRSPDETRAGRLWRRRRDLARTGELRAQAELRNQFSAFHIDPLQSPRR